MAINPGQGASSEYFGHIDYDAARNSGYSNESILQYLQARFKANLPRGTFLAAVVSMT